MTKESELVGEFVCHAGAALKAYGERRDFSSFTGHRFDGSNYLFFHGPEEWCEKVSHYVEQLKKEKKNE